MFQDHLDPAAEKSGVVPPAHAAEDGIISRLERQGEMTADLIRSLGHLQDLFSHFSDFERREPDAEISEDFNEASQQISQVASNLAHAAAAGGQTVAA